MNRNYRTLTQILLDIIREKARLNENSLERVVYCVEQLCRFSPQEIDEEIHHLLASGKIKLDGNRLLPGRKSAGRQTLRSLGRSAPGRISGEPAGSRHKAGSRRFRVDYATTSVRIA